MDHIDYNALIKQAHALRAQEIHRILSGAKARLQAFAKVQLFSLRTHLSHLAHRFLSWNPRAHPFH